MGVKWIEPKPGAQEMIDLVKAFWDQQIASGVNVQKASLEATKLLKAHIKKHKTKLSGGLRQYNKVDEQGLIFREGPLYSPTYSESLIYEFKHPVTGEVLETPENGWRASFETMKEWIANGEVVFGADHTKQPTRKLVLDTKNDQVPLPTFEADRDSATKHLERLLGKKRFPNPKSHEVLERWLSIFASSDAVILDFFAGSGTTAEAVVRLNDLDGGKRRCILVTNNELSQKSAKQLKSAGHKPGDEAWESQGVYRYVTMPRIKSLLTGARPDGTKHGEPLPGNAYFMDLKYLDPDLVSLGETLDSLSHLLWLKSGATGSPLDLKKTDSFALAEDSNYAVLLKAGVWRKAISQLADQDHIRHLFVVTDSDSVFQQVSSEVGSHVETTMLYEDYLSNFQVIAG
jgi:adenine-specific DNA-methyltransferase